MSLIPLIQRTLNSLLKLGDMTDTGNLKQLLREHVATAYPLAEAYQKSYTDTLEVIHAAVSPGWKDWLGARRKQQFIAQVAHYYLMDFVQVKGWPPEGTELITFKNTAAPQYQALLKDSQSLFRTAALPPFTEDELAGIIAVKGLPNVTQLVLERLGSFQIRLPEAEALAFLQHQELLGKGIEFFLRHHPEVAAQLQGLQTTGLWDAVQNMEKELTELKQAGVREQIRVEDEFKTYDNQTLRRVCQAVALLRKRAVKPAAACQTWLMAGSAVFTLGEMGQARQLLEEALQLAQTEAETALVHFNLFQVYIREDTTAYNEVAFHHLQTAMNLDTQYRFYDTRKYQLQRFLGAGGMGCAFVGLDLVFQREVVIKWFWQNFTTDKEVQRVFKEALLMKRVPREYVPEPLDVSLHGDSACLITEYLSEAIDGESWLRLHGSLSAKEAMSVALQLARGLQAAHQQGIWHLDLKPANVLLYREQSELLAKIIDFGLSRLAQPLMSQVRRSQRQSSQLGFRLAGTWDYAAPELRGIMKYGPLSAKSDVYGLGKTLMRLCTGKSPQDCRERDLPIELREVVFDCIEEDPTLRPDSTAVIAWLQGVIPPDEPAKMAKPSDEEMRDLTIIQQLQEFLGQELQLLEEVNWNSKCYRRTSNKQVVGLSLYYMGLAEIPKEVWQLTQLQELLLMGNQLTQLPPEIGQLTQLQELLLMGNQLTQLPPEIGQLTQLQGLWLSANQLTQLPSEIGQLAQLQELYVESNQLTQLPPEIGRLTLLQELMLEDNRLTQLPSEIGQLTQLQELYLGHNRLTQLPVEIGQLTQLQGLWLGTNQLTLLPPEIGQLTQLQGLNLENNQLTLLPKEIGLLTQLRGLYLDNNPLQVPPPKIIQQGTQAVIEYFQGTGQSVIIKPSEPAEARHQQVTDLTIIQQLQKSLGQELPQLEAIKVGSKGYQLNTNNQVVGLALCQMNLTEIPKEIWQLTRLQKLILETNLLSQLPPEIGQLTMLQGLGLWSNRLTQLPTDIGRLTMLRVLRLCGNQLTQLPTGIGQLTQLQTLTLNGNQLTQLPPEIGQLTRLQTLTLNNNQLIQLPPEIGQLTCLQTLTLNNNQLIQLPPEIGRLTQLQTLTLNSNQLTRLPPEIGRLTQLQKLWLHGNPLPVPPKVIQAGTPALIKYLQETGPAVIAKPPEPEAPVNDLTIIQRLQDSLGQGLLPLEEVKLDSKGYRLNARKQVIELALCQMNLTEIPKMVWQLTQLQCLWLRDNQLNQLPKEIGRLTQLRKLDLEDNHLTQLPSEMERLTQLQMLSLWGNRLTQLSPEIGLLTQLQNLNLWGNQLSYLPKAIGRLTQLQILNVGNNKLTRLPSEIGQLTQLQKLGMGHNKLTQLPAEIGLLTQLQFLDVGNNKLTQLPSEVRQLTQLQELYLDNNPLRVPPPKVIQQGTQAVIKYFKRKWWWW